MPYIVATVHAIRLFLGLRQGGEKHAGQNANNGNYHQQLNQCESLILIFHDLIQV